MSFPQIDPIEIPLEVRAQIATALDSFANVPREKWFREIALCLLTPQSSPFRAEAAITQLETRGFFEGNLSEHEVAAVLGNPAAYVRFHKTKAKRLIEIRERRSEIEQIVGSEMTPGEEREQLVRLVKGFGFKEASHALRNIGRRNLAILDRHILRRLVEFGVLQSYPATLSIKRYIEIEGEFLTFAASTAVPLDVLDLYFWWQGTGLIFK